MRRVFLGLIALVVLLLPLSRGQQATPQPQQPQQQQQQQDKGQAVLALSLEDAIMRTIKNNYGVAIQVLYPEIADQAVSVARQIFYPQMSFGYSNRSTDTASFSFLDASQSVATKYYSYNAGISQLLPTGGTLAATVTNYRNNTSSNFQTINPRYGSSLEFDFQQPLLRGFGSKITRYNILISENNYAESQSNLEATIAAVINSVTQAYWNLTYSIETLKARQEALELAQNLLANNQRAVEVGTLAPIEILSAEAEVATRKADILSAQADVKNNEDQLRTIINLPEAEMKQALPIKPLDTPKFVERKMNVDEALGTALENRPELKSLKYSVKNEELSLSLAENQRLPSLNLTASYWSPGISGDQILYEGNNPLTGAVIGRIPGGIGNAIRDAFGFKYNNWQVGVTLGLPLSSIFSDASVVEARLNRDQAVLQLKNEEQTIYLQIRNGVRTLQTNYERVQAYKVARELAEQKLQAEQEKLRVGLSTNFTVLSYQRDLSDARISELRAVVDYLNSDINLETYMGVSLKNRGIAIQQLMNR
jgi:outer membrane protein TolC